MIYLVEETRQSILFSAKELFLEQGFFHAQMTDVAARTGLSRATLYRYYSDKMDFGLAVLATIFEDISVHLEDVLGKPEAQGEYANAREQLIRGLARVIADPRCLLFGAEASRRSSKPSSDYLSGAQEQLLSGLVARGMEEGSIRDDLDPDVLLTTCLYSKKCLYQQVVSRSGVLLNVPIEQMHDLVNMQIQIMLDGIEPQGKAA